MTRLGGSFDWDRVSFTMSDVSLDLGTQMGADLETIDTEQSRSGDILPDAREGLIISSE